MRQSCVISERTSVNCLEGGPGELFEVRVEARLQQGAKRSRRVAIHARARELNHMAIVVDFRKLHHDAITLMAELDAEPRPPDLRGSRSEAYVVAAWLFNRASDLLLDERTKISAVEVEDGGSWVIYPPRQSL